MLNPTQTNPAPINYHSPKLEITLTQIPVTNRFYLLHTGHTSSRRWSPNSIAKYLLLPTKNNCWKVFEEGQRKQVISRVQVVIGPQVAKQVVLLAKRS